MTLSARFEAAWANLARRERALIATGLLVLLPVAMYFYFWQPLADERARLQSRVAQLRAELVRLRGDSEEVKRLRGQAPIRGAQSLEASVRLAASRFQLEDKLAGITPQGADRLLVDMDDVAFDAWLRWVGELAVQGVSLNACKVEALAAAGRVRAQATLSRGAP